MNGNSIGLNEPNIDTKLNENNENNKLIKNKDIEMKDEVENSYDYVIKFALDQSSLEIVKQLTILGMDDDEVAILRTDGFSIAILVGDDGKITILNVADDDEVASPSRPWSNLKKSSGKGYLLKSCFVYIPHSTYTCMCVW